MTTPPKDHPQVGSSASDWERVGGFLQETRADGGKRWSQVSAEYEHDPDVTTLYRKRAPVSPTDTSAPLSLPEFQEATWGVDSVMRPCKSMAISEYAFRRWAKDVGIVLAADPILSDDVCDAYQVPRGSRRSEVHDD